MIDRNFDPWKRVRAFNPEVLLHCCNYDGFLSRSKDVVPHDGKNLNREFPETVNGTQTQKLAAFLETAIIRNTDYLVDLHSGGFCEALVPHAYYHGAAKPEICAASCRIAGLTSAKYMVRSEAKKAFTATPVSAVSPRSFWSAAAAGCFWRTRFWRILQM